MATYNQKPPVPDDPYYIDDDPEAVEDELAKSRAALRSAGGRAAPDMEFDVDEVDPLPDMEFDVDEVDPLPERHYSLLDSLGAGAASAAPVKALRAAVRAYNDPREEDPDEHGTGYDLLDAIGLDRILPNAASRGLRKFSRASDELSEEDDKAIAANPNVAALGNAGVNAAIGAAALRGARSRGPRDLGDAPVSRATTPAEAAETQPLSRQRNAIPHEPSDGTTTPTRRMQRRNAMPPEPSDGTETPTREMRTREYQRTPTRELRTGEYDLDPPEPTSSRDTLEAEIPEYLENRQDRREYFEGLRNAKDLRSPSFVNDLQERVDAYVAKNTSGARKPKPEVHPSQEANEREFWRQEDSNRQKSANRYDAKEAVRAEARKRGAGRETQELLDKSLDDYFRTEEDADNADDLAAYNARGAIDTVGEDVTPRRLRNDIGDVPTARPKMDTLEGEVVGEPTPKAQKSSRPRPELDVHPSQEANNAKAKDARERLGKARGYVRDIINHPDTMKDPQRVAKRIQDMDAAPWVDEARSRIAAEGSIDTTGEDVTSTTRSRDIGNAPKSYTTQEEIEDAFAAGELTPQQAYAKLTKLRKASGKPVPMDHVTSSKSKLRNFAKQSAR